MHYWWWSTASAAIYTEPPRTTGEEVDGLGRAGGGGGGGGGEPDARWCFAKVTADRKWNDAPPPRRRWCSIWKYVRAPVTLLSRSHLFLSLAPQLLSCARCVFFALLLITAPLIAFFTIGRPRCRLAPSRKTRWPAGLMPRAPDPILKRRKLPSRYGYCCSEERWACSLSEFAILIVWSRCKISSRRLPHQAYFNHTHLPKNLNRNILRSNVHSYHNSVGTFFSMECTAMKGINQQRMFLIPTAGWHVWK